MSALILALNPSIDAEWRVDDVVWEEKNNVQSERRWAGGKGINVARWLKHLGGKSQLLLPLGGSTGDELAGYLRQEKIVSTIVPLHEPTRVNVIVTTQRGRQMRFNPLGPKVSTGEWSRLRKRVERELARLSAEQGRARHSVRAVLRQSKDGAHGVTRSTGLLILSGSLPRGVAVSAYQKLITLAHQHGVKTLLDCDGAPFAAAIKAHPFLVKPNEHELASWWGKPLRTESELLQAARKLSVTTKGWVLVSRGGKRSWLVNSSEGVEIHATPTRVKPRNTVGAGDALLAAVAQQIMQGKPPADWLRCGLETGTAATQSQAGKLPGR